MKTKSKFFANFGLLLIGLIWCTCLSILTFGAVWKNNIHLTADIVSGVREEPVAFNGINILDELVSDPLEIEISGTTYPIIYSGRTASGPISVTEAGFGVHINGSALVKAWQTGIKGYRLSHFEIYKSDQYVELKDNALLDSSYINIDVVSVVGVYVDICEVLINIPREYKDMGSYALYVKDNESGKLTKVAMDPSNIYEFDVNTTLIIEALPKDFHKFVQFRQNYKNELVVGTPTKLQSKLLIDRAFSLYFDKITYKIDTKNKTNNAIEISANELKLGDEIFVYLNISSPSEVKDFKINGISVNHEDYKGDVVFTNNVATIRVTEDWLAGYKNVLDIEVTTKLNDTFFICILAASVIIPMLLIFIIYLNILGRKQKKATEGIIKGKRAYQQRMSAGDFIKDLKEGNFTGKITDKEIKEELDNQKKL